MASSVQGDLLHISVQVDVINDEAHWVDPEDRMERGVGIGHVASMESLTHSLVGLRVTQESIKTQTTHTPNLSTRPHALSAQ